MSARLPSYTSNSDALRALALALKLAVFSLPILLFVGTMEWALYSTRESWPISSVIRLQEGEGESIFERGIFPQQFGLYKFEVVRERHASVLVIGSSRVMQFRGFMFRPFDKEFYNCGGVIQNLSDLVAFARMIDEGKIEPPKVLIIGVEPWWVSKNKQAAEQPSELGRSKDYAYDLPMHVYAARAMISNRAFPWGEVLLNKRGGREPLYGYKTLGVGAFAVGRGIRSSDGSHLYGGEIADYVNRPSYRDREGIIELIRETKGRFSPSDGVDPRRVELLIQQLLDIKSHGVELYTYLPPVATEVMRALETSDKLSRWWHEYRFDLRERLAEAGFTCLPVSTPADFGLTDDSMLDGYHPGEILNVHLLVNLVDQAKPGSRLAGVDRQNLAALKAGSNQFPLSFDVPRSFQPNSLVTSQ